MTDKNNNDSDESLDKKNRKNRSVNVGEMLYQDDPTNLKSDDDSENNGGFNERLRDMDVEMQEEAQAAEESIIPEEEQGFERDQERSFDPVTHKKETEEEVEAEAAIEQGIDEEDIARSHKRKKGKGGFKAWLMQKLGAKRSHHKTKETQEHMTLAAKVMERISTYRHHSINTPGNQAGVFDNIIEENKEQVAETIARAAAAREVLQEGLEMLEASQKVAQEAMEQAAKRAAEPYVQQVEQGVEVLNAVRNGGKGLDMDSGLDFDPMGKGQQNGQSVNNTHLGRLENDARLNASEKDTGRGI